MPASAPAPAPSTVPKVRSPRVSTERPSRPPAIAPGYIDTDMVAAVPEDVLDKIVAKIPVKRLGQANEIARGVAFLCAENGGFVTGSTLSINGGQHMY